jgi:hypothetical protein
MTQRWFHDKYPVIGLWIGIRVRSHNKTPYKIPYKQNDRMAKEREGIRNEIMYGYAIPAKALFRK